MLMRAFVLKTHVLVWWRVCLNGAARAVVPSCPATHATLIHIIFGSDGKVKNGQSRIVIASQAAAAAASDAAAILMCRATHDSSQSQCPPHPCPPTPHSQPGPLCNMEEVGVPRAADEVCA